VAAVTSEVERKLFIPPLTTVVVGDTCMDDLFTGMKDRRWHRRGFSLGPTQKLVVASSTWGPRSLFATSSSTIDDLAFDLPIDEYVVAIILHPNIWNGHGEWQVKLWLRRALKAGAILIPYQQGWRSAIVAADYIVGDHGSVTYYGAMLGIPTVLGALGEDELIPGTPLETLARKLPRLSGDTRKSVEGLPRGVDLTRHADILRAASDFPGQALERTRGLIYRMMNLDLPHYALRAEGPRPYLATPEPHLACRARWSIDQSSAVPVVSIERLPLGRSTSDVEARDEIVCADVDEAALRARDEAAILYSMTNQERSIEEAHELSQHWLQEFPLSQLVATQLSLNLMLISNRETSWTVTSAPSGGFELPIVACAVRALRVSQSTSLPPQVDIRCGGRSSLISIE
jgi:hypothetical protein